MMDAQAAAPLGPDDYQALAGMLMSEDADVRTQGQALAKKLTPAEQQSFFDVQKEMHRGAPERVDTDVASGIPIIGNVSPEALVGGAGALRNVVQAAAAPGLNLAGRAVSGVKSAVEQATPLVKYEATKMMLERMGVPGPMAAIAAAAVSGYKRGAKGEPAPAASPADAPHLDLSRPVQPGSLTPAQMAERAAAVKAGGGLEFEMPRRGADGRPVKPVSSRVAPDGPAAESVALNPVAQELPAATTARTTAPPPSSESTPSALPDQRALNEEALARRRAEYQARVASEPPPTPTKFVPTPDEMQEYMRLIKAGKSHAEAGRSIVAQRELKAHFDLKTPTVEETKFPKGMRGKTP